MGYSWLLKCYHILSYLHFPFDLQRWELGCCFHYIITALIIEAKEVCITCTKKRSQIVAKVTKTKGIFLISTPVFLSLCIILSCTYWDTVNSLKVILAFMKLFQRICGAYLILFTLILFTSIIYIWPCSKYLLIPVTSYCL